MIYVDTSAFVKLVWEEVETPALKRYLVDRADQSMVSSALLAIEARRTVLRDDPMQLPRADLMLTRVGLVGITDAIVESASRLPEPGLRSLDAVHLATALLLGSDIEVLLSYDKRLLAATATYSVATVSPGLI